MEKKTRHYYDFSLLIITIVLVSFGLVMIFSSSSYMAQTKFNDDLHFLSRQGRAVIVGVILMLIISKLDYKLLIAKFKFLPVRLCSLAYIGALALQILVLFIGQDYNGAKRWILIPVFGTFQPSELSKIAVIIFTAFLCYQAPRVLDRPVGFIRNCIYVGPIIVLIAKENLSSAIIVAAIFFVICFVTGRKHWYYYVIAVLAVAGLAAALYFGQGYRTERVDIWLNLETHPKGYQILQGLYAIASGGLFGTGLGNSMQKLGNIPESYNDMIFTIICEELGILGAIAVIALFLMLIWRILIISVNAPDLYGSLICVGVLVQIAVQVALNIAVVTNTIPSTGISLPFISYGGTSVVLLLCEIGLVLSVSGHINYEN